MKWVAFVQHLGGVEVVGEAGTKEEAIELARPRALELDGWAGAARAGSKLPCMEPRSAASSGTPWRKRAAAKVKPKATERLPEEKDEREDDEEDE